MISLRKLVDGWKQSAEPELGAERDEWDVGSANALEHCADSLSAELAKYERLVKAVEAYMEGGTRERYVELQAAIKEVRE